MRNSERYFSNSDCPWFPCHTGADPEDFNCLFCYCPLYALGEGCGGDYQYLPNGVKDCSACLYPHKAAHYEEILRRFADIAKLAAKK